MNHLAYSRPGRAGVPVWISGLAALTLLGGVACTAGVKATGAGSGGNGGSGATGSGGKAGTGAAGQGQGNTSGDVGLTGTGGGTPNPDAASCQQKEVMFTATNPTVFILVDRSGSEFTSATAGTFFDLRTAVEQVISSTVGGSSLDSQVRFGVGSFVGDHASGSCLLNYQSVPIALNNAATIKTAYDGWGPLQPYGSKADTPAVEAIPMVKAALQADTGTGQKYMMIVSDSETDFCDDGNALCPADAVTHMIQDMYNATPSIGTLVIGLPTAISNIATAVLQNFANAGVGQPVAVPTGSGAATATDVYYQCTGMTNGGADSWSSLFTAAGRTGMTSLATYSATAGTATVYTPAAGGAQALADQISMALAGVRSCTFDLPGFTIDTRDPSQLNGADIYIVTSSGSHVPLSYDPTDTNGWDMTTPTELQLYGPACDQLRAPSTTDIKFNFPCKIVICIDNCI